MWTKVFLRRTWALIALGLFCVACKAQSPLGQAFVDMKSTDAMTAQKAKDDFVNLLVQEMPNIERDAGPVCSALTSPDPYIRLQATVVFQTIVVAAPQHNQVVLGCTDGLIGAASDTNDRTRNNALFALAMNPAGPPAKAQRVFESELGSDNLRSVEIAAAGLIKMDGGKNLQNQQTIANKLASAPDSKHRLNLLYAISGSKVQSDVLYQASQECITDSDADVQDAAIDALVATGTNPGRTVGVLEGIKNSAASSAQAKEHADRVLQAIQAQK